MVVNNLMKENLHPHSIKTISLSFRSLHLTTTTFNFIYLLLHPYSSCLRFIDYVNKPLWSVCECLFVLLFFHFLFLVLIEWYLKNPLKGSFGYYVSEKSNFWLPCIRKILNGFHSLTLNWKRSKLVNN